MLFRSISSATFDNKLVARTIKRFVRKYECILLDVLWYGNEDGLHYKYIIREMSSVVTSLHNPVRKQSHKNIIISVRLIYVSACSYSTLNIFRAIYIVHCLHIILVVRAQNVHQYILPVCS